MLKPKKAKLALALSLALAASAPAFAQTTSAGLGGQIISGSGEAVEGATVEIVHEPSGTRSSMMTDASGRYSARGLRVGGPYTVTVTKDGQSAVEENVYLTLNDVSSVVVVLDGGGQELETVQVTGTVYAGSDIFMPDRIGAKTNITQDQIEALPSIRRSLDDYVRLDPRVVQIDKTRGGLSVAGQNNRYNNIRIDGVPTNDQFGLNDSGVPALNQPISIDWIQEFNVGISDYDVTQGDFVGGNINAVTKSGGNEFHGSFYGIYRESGWVGDDENGNEFTGFDDEWTGGGWVSGPIIEDTLFFFVGYEKFERASPAPSFGIIDSGATNIVDVTADEIADIQSIASGYGIDAGGLASVSEIVNEDEKSLVKIDWNINEDHRSFFRYNKTEGNILRTPGVSNSTVALTSHWYQDVIVFENFAAGLYSNWTDNFSSEFNISYSEYDSAPALNAVAPQITVTAASGDRVLLGTERFRHANILGVDTLTAFWAGDLFVGDHTIRFGADYEESDVFNLFLESSLGVYAFDSIDDFASGAYASYLLRSASSGGPAADAAASFRFENLGLFVQDTWTITPNLTLLYGLRVDNTGVPDDPAFNQQFFDAFGQRNDATPDGNTLVQPRLGFNYTFDTERATQLRGGFGLFQGSPPGVWISNSFTNTGTTISVLSNNQGGQTGQIGPGTPPDDLSGGSAPRQDVDLTEEDFDLPSVWKANLAFEHELPWMGLVAGTEFLWTQTLNGVHYEHLNLGDATGVLPDGRAGYWASYDPANFRDGNSGGPINGNRTRANQNGAFNNVLLLRNTNKGYANNITLSLEKPWTDNWYAKLAYTYGEANDVNPGTSSRAISNWVNRLVFNPNEDISATSNYEIKNRVTGAFSYRWNFFEDSPTTFAVFYEGREGRPYSFAFTGDANGDSANGQFGDNAVDLFYIPSGPDDVLFSAQSSEADIAAFWDYIEGNEYLSANGGQVAERNALNSPWTHQFDVRLSQEIGFFWDTNAEIFLDILNIGNLIDDEWGQIDEAGFPYRLEMARFAGVQDGQYVYNVSGFANNPPELQRQDGNGQSRWAAQVGLRFEF